MVAVDLALTEQKEGVRQFRRWWTRYAALMAAARDGRERVVRRLLAAGAEPNKQEDSGLSALLFAAGHSDSAGAIAELVAAAQQ